MKLFSAVCLLACELFFSCHKADNPFFVKVVTTKQRKSANDFKSISSIFYQDENFTASEFCMGEFGGHLLLKDRKTQVIYECSATCPLAVNILNGKYLVTATLAHGSGFSQVIEITNPYLLTTRPISNNASRISRISSLDSAIFKIGTRILADTMSLLTVGSFLHKKQLYHVMTDFRKTYLAKNSFNRFIIIDTIANFSTMTYYPHIIHTKNNHYITLFKNNESQGYLDVHGDSITVFRYQ